MYVEFIFRITFVFLFGKETVPVIDGSVFLQTETEAPVSKHLSGIITKFLVSLVFAHVDDFFFKCWIIHSCNLPGNIWY